MGVTSRYIFSTEMRLRKIERLRKYSKIFVIPMIKKIQLSTRVTFVTGV